ncbi:MAG: protein kinase [Deltaproteobacteria bacterium]|nr:protein kinase [Deltaproteobacteria bacterium]
MNVAADPSAHQAPRRVGRYLLLTEIASGGMASVHLGCTQGVGGFQRVVAVKLCHPHLERDEDFSAMFLDEARLAARIHHPNVVATLDVGTDTALHMVMEYVEGDRLLSIMRAAKKQKKLIPIEIVLRIMIETLSGLHAAHDLLAPDGSPLNIIHRDVSPQNILVGFDGITKLADFGVAKAEARAATTGADGAIKGKVPYLAPEQIAGESLNRQVDIFAAGVVLWEALVGRRLFRGETDAETLQRVLTEPIAPPSTLRPDVPPELDAAVMHALARKKSERFASAIGFAEALENCRVKVASHRMVADYMRTTLADVYTQRVELRQQLDRTILDIANGDQAEAIIAAPARASSTSVDTSPHSMPDSLDSIHASHDAILGRKRGATPGWIWALGGAGLVLAGVLLSSLTQKNSTQTVATQNTPRATAPPIVPPSPPPAAPLAVRADPAPEVLAPATPATTPVVAAAQSPTPTPAIAHTPRSTPRIAPTRRTSPPATAPQATPPSSDDPRNRRFNAI